MTDEADGGDAVSGEADGTTEGDAVSGEANSVTGEADTATEEAETVVAESGPSTDESDAGSANPGATKRERSGPGTGRREVPYRATVSAAVGFFAVALVLVGVRSATDLLPAVVRTPVVTIPPIVLAFTFVPGALFLLALRDDDELGAEWIAYAGGLSLLIVMAVGLVVNVVLPRVGITEPLSASVYAPAMAVAVAVLAAACFASEGPEATLIVPTPSPLAPAPLFFLLLPLLGVLTITHMNQTGDNRPLVAVYFAVALVPLAAWFLVDREWHALAVWSTAYSILLTEGLKSGASFPGNPVVVFTWIAGRWVPGTNGEQTISTELLQHGTIFPGFANFANVDIMTQMAQVNPLFVSLIPLALFVAFRQYVDSRIAVLGAAVFAFAHPYYNQYVMAGRAGTPVVFVSLFALALSDRGLSRVNASLLTMAFGLGVVWTHYGTSYFVMAALVPAFALLVGLWLFDGVVEGALERGAVDLRSAPRDAIRSVRDKPPGPGLTISFVTFFVVATFSWFLYTNGGRGFELFPRQFASVLTDLFSQSDSTGRTAARLERNYGSLVIAVSKRLYLLLAAMIGLGIAIALYERYDPTGWLALRDGDGVVDVGTSEAGGRWSGKSPFDDRFIALAATMLAIFGSTLVFRTWGGGRPMMISFAFTTIFAAYAAVWIGRELSAAVESRWSRRPPWILGESGAGSAFAVLLALMFLLNSGTVTALGLEGQAPSDTPIPGDDSLEVDVAAHAWVIDHNPGTNVYGDYIAFGQTDWRLPAIAARTEGLNRYGPERPRGDVQRLTRPDAAPGYLVMLKHNVESGELTMYMDDRPIDDIREEYRENVVYTTGNSRVHYIPPDDDEQ